MHSSVVRFLEQPILQAEALRVVDLYVSFTVGGEDQIVITFWVSGFSF